MRSTSKLHIAAGQNTAERDYWLEKLSGDLVKTCFPYDYKKEPGNERAMNTIRFRFPEGLYSRIVHISDGSDVRIFIILLTGLLVLLERYSGNNDIIVGVPIYKQDADVEFINTLLAIRQHIHDHMQFKELLVKVGQTVYDALENRNYPLEILMDRLNIPVTGDDFSLFDVVLIFENLHDKRYILDIHPNAVFSFLRKNSRLEGILEYNASLFDKTAIERICTHYIHLLAVCLSDVHLHLSVIDILSEEEKNRLLFDFNDTAADSPGNRTIHGLFEDQAAKTPDNTAVIGRRAGEDARFTVSVSYRELNKRANRMAGLLKRKGVKPGLIVGIMVTRSLMMSPVLLGILKSGCAYLPIEPGLPEMRKKYMVENSGLKVLVKDSGSVSGTTISSIINVDIRDRSLDPEEISNPGNEVDASHSAYIIYTSGTTGKPKGVVIEHGSAVNTLACRREEYKMSPGVVSIQLFSYVFDGFVTGFFTPLASGARVVLTSAEESKDVMKIKEAIVRHGVTHFICVPSLFRAIILSLTAEEAARLEVVTLAGEKISPDILDITTQKDEHMEIVNEYGVTEAAVMSTVGRHLEKAGRIHIGKPARNTCIYILNERGGLQSIGIPGELCISGAGLARGYLNHPELTAEKFIKHKLHDSSEKTLYKTGDLGRWMPDGNIEFLGRIDYQVKIRGYRIELGEIEARLMKHRQIEEAVVAVIGPGDKTGPLLCAYIVPEKELNLIELKEYLSSQLPDYMIPSYYVQLEKMPLTPTGKVDRKALPEPGTTLEEQGTYTAPRNEREEKLVAIWSEELGVEKNRIGIDANFFQLGGHSLKASMMAAKIHKQLDTKVPLMEIFKTPTIRGLAGFIEKARREKHLSVEPVEKKEYYPLSSAQERLYLLQQMVEGNIGYNMPQTMVVEGDIENRGMEEVFKKLIRRHESLRTSFHLLDERPVQRVHPAIDFLVEKITGGDDAAAGIVKDFVYPFDLSHAPLLRAGLVTVGVNRHILMLDMHHIITDGVSQQVLVTEFMSIYRGKELPALRLHYKDYAQWQNNEKEKEAIKRQEEYWLKEFGGVIPVLDLPTDYPRPAMQSFEGSTIRFRLDAEQSGSLNEMAREAGATVFMLLLALFDMFLSRLGGREDVVVGIPSAGRKHADLEKVIGMFVNTLGLRSFPRGAKTFRAFSGEVKKKTLEAFENQDYQFEDLVEKAAAERDMSRNPLFDAMLVWQNLPGVQPGITAEDGSPPLKIKPYDSEHQTSKFDLTLYASGTEEALYFTFAYSTKLFKRETVETFSRYFKTMVSAVIENPDRKISSIEILSEEEKKRITVDFNNTKAGYPGNRTMCELFENRSGKNPDRVALVGPAGGGSSSRNIFVTYNILNKESTQLACRLRRKGVLPGNIAGIRVEPAIGMLTGILGILKAGCAYLPIDADYPAERIDFMLKDSNAAVVLNFEHLNFEFVSNFEFRASNLSSSELAYIIYTSGTTGQPKGVMLTHGNLANYVYWFMEKAGITCEDKALLTSSAAFDLGYTSLFPSLSAGASLHIIPQEVYLSADRLLTYIRWNRVTYLKITPSLFSTFSHSTRFSANTFRYLRLIVLGGESIIPGDVEKIRQICGHIRIINHYGPTEATIGSISQVIPFDFDGFERYKRKPTIGTPVSNSGVYILDKHLRLQPVGIPGELCIFGLCLARGYLNRPELTAERFFKRWRQRIYKTGDLARWCSNGTIEFLGRIDDQVKVRGYRIELGEIESLLTAYNGIKEAVVILQENESGEAYPGAYIVSNDAGTPSIRELRDYLLNRLPGYMVPWKFMFLDRIPLTPNGKLDRKALPAFGDVKERYSAPRDEMEEKLVEVWKTVLRPGGMIGIDDNFFQLGGYSLKAALLTANIRREMGLKVPLSQVFKSPTIREMARFLRDSREEKYIPLEAVEKKEYYVLSSAQKRMYIMQDMELETTVYNMPQAIPLAVETSKEEWEDIFRRLIKRHEVLRTRFTLVNDEPVQVVPDEVEFEVEYYGKDVEIEKIKNSFIRPFDLTKAPLLRAALIKNEEPGDILLVDMHHIVSDGVSRRILVEDFLSLMTGSELPGLRCQYKDYAEWQNRDWLSESAVLKTQEKFWLNRFNGKIPQLNLPLDYQRPPVLDFKGDRVEFGMGRDLAAKVKTAALETGTTLYMMLLAVYTIFLAKYTGQEDIVVCSPTAARTHPDLKNIIGMFVNMLPMRNFPARNKTFKEFLGEVKENSIEALENQDYQFDTLVEKLRQLREWTFFNRNPLNETVFVMQNMETQSQPQEELQGEDTSLPAEPEGQDHEMDFKIAKFDLKLSGTDNGDRVYFNFEYCSQLFKRETVQRMSGHFINIIEEVVTNPGIKISEIRMLAGGETDALIKKLKKQRNPVKEDIQRSARNSGNKKIECNFDF